MPTCARQQNTGFRPPGFTLVELVVVLVLLSITALTLTTIFSDSVTAYLDSAARQERALSGRAAVDRLSRELREAMPLSIRVGDGGRCLQFLPIVAASFYSELTTPATRIPVAPFALTSTAGLYVAIAPTDAASLYNQIALAPVSAVERDAGNNVIAINLNPAKSFPRTTPGQRVFLVAQPVSYCLLANGEIRRGTSALNTQPARSDLAAGALLSNGLDGASATTTFTYTLGSTRANALVTMNFEYLRRGERLTFNHEVRLRNVQ